MLCLQDQKDQAGSYIKKFQTTVKTLTTELPKKGQEAAKARGLAEDKAAQVDKLTTGMKAEETRAADLEKQAQEARWTPPPCIPSSLLLPRSAAAMISS